MAYLLITTLSILTAFISILPIFSAIPQGIFYGFDPDAVYVGNALSYIQSHQIQYPHHPGTPAIRLIALSLLPLRLYTKYIIRQPFIDWAFLHYDFIFTYSRFFQAILFGIAIFVLLTALWHFSHSRLAIIFTWVALLVFWPVPYLGSIISPETVSVLLASLWLLILYQFLKKRSPATLLSLSFLAGVTLANKTTNISFILASLVLCMAHYRRQLIYSRLTNLILNTLAVAGGFLFGIWPIRDRLLTIIKININLASRTGAHGSGRVALIDFSTHLANLKTFHSQNPVILPLVIIGLILAIYYLFSKSKKIPIEVPLIYISFFLIFMAFFKFPLFHYQITNYFVLLFLSSIFITIVLKPALFFLCLVFLWFLPVSIQRYYREINQLVNHEKILENFIVIHPPQIASVWEWGRTHDFAYIWARSWSNGLFDRQLQVYRPDLLELNSDFKTISQTYSTHKPVFDSCWDQLYIQQKAAPRFLDMYPDQPFTYTIIPNTTMALITSDHCVVSSNSKK